MFCSRVRYSTSRFLHMSSLIRLLSTEQKPMILSQLTWQGDASTKHLCRRPIHTSTWLAKKKAKKEKKSSKSSHKLDDEDDEDLPQSSDELLDMKEVNAKYAATITALRQDFTSTLALRTSQRSFSSLPIELDNGERVDLKYIAQVSMKTPNLVQINLHSNTQYLTKVRDALRGSSLNVNPRIDQNTIFIDIPKVTREHREKLSKSAKVLADKYKVKLRDTQNAILKVVKGADKSFGDDRIRTMQEEIQKLTKVYSKQIDDAVKEKQKELLNDG